MIQNVNVKIDISQIADKTKIDDDSVIYIFIGNHGHPVRVNEFIKMMNGDCEYSPEHIIRNCAINAGLAKVDITDIEAIKKHIEEGVYKI